MIEITRFGQIYRMFLYEDGSVRYEMISDPRLYGERVPVFCRVYNYVQLALAVMRE